MKVYYLEVVTGDVEGVCGLYEAMHGVTFAEPEPMLGGARVADMNDGKIGVRAPLREDEDPVTRPYWLVDDIHAAWAHAEEAGCELAHAPMEIPGICTFAIYFCGGVEHALWQLP